MAKRRDSFGAGVSEEDKKKVNKEGLKNALRIFRFVAPYKGTFIIGMFFLIFSNLTTMTFPLLIGEMTKVIEGKSKYQINEVTIFFFGVLIVQAVLSFFRIYTFSQVSEKAMRDVRKSLYSKIITLPVFFFEKRRVGELMSRITSDVTQLQDVLSVTLAEFFRQVFTLVGGIAFISYISWKLTLFMLGTFPFLVIAAMVFGKFIRKVSKKAQDELANTNVVVEETLQSINVVKAFTNEHLEINRYSLSLQKVVNNALKAATFRGGFVSFIIFALFGGIVGVVWFGAQLVASGDLILAELLTFIFYTAFIGGSVGGLGDIYAQLQKTIGASERITEILDEVSEINPDKSSEIFTPVKGNIIYENVAFTYPSRPDMQILKNVSLEVKSGEKIALVGYSGAGKSTIVQLLMRYYELNAGTIKIDGKNINAYDLTDLRKNIAVVPQEVMLFGGTIYENISYGKPDATEAEVFEAARKANALQFIDSFPEKFQTLVGERGVKLSGGQRQRIAIARAILKNPAILILDEATSALDSESEKLVQEALDGLMQNRTTIIIAHRLATIRNVDTIYVLRDGEVIETGSHDELLLLDDGIYSNLVKLQYETTSTEQVSVNSED
ncbi:ABC transporter, permease/ATP-binding protein [Pseudarcicella hirudinis]|uniref:ABC transporter, permease/ATP-binding protein n=1 Tax=Pseudarcicella hirudinis TaxID=1079859 RepID=A0A1I5XQD6_9BACT|nr:ABC transporter transmembrane domain-containing protein [Pseudarcicella hirudinis]SFQ34148.1 ABC transporter, permease/ATP-binding protein [Pseudarcicella hirudinis]